MRRATRFVGIDIGADRVHVASLGCRHEPRNIGANPNASLAWLSRSEFAMPIDVEQVPDPGLVDRVCDALTDRLPRCVDGERQVAALSLPMPWIHYETTPADDLPQSKSACDSMFVASVFQSEAHFRHWPICDGKDQHVVAATARDAACRIAAVVERAGYRVQTILPQGVALIHAARELTSIAPHSVALLELFGGLVAVNNANRCGLCRSLPACDFAGESPPYVDQIEPWLQEIAAQVNATARYVTRLAGRSEEKGPLLICGSVAEIDGVDEALATMLGRPVATWRYASRCRPIGANDPSEDVTRADPSRAVALSLAQCAASRFAIGGR